MTTKIGVGKAMPKEATDADAVSAMRDLERDVRELMHMADMAAGAIEDYGTRIDKDKERVTIRFTRHEHDQLAFLVNNVSVRANLLQDRFNAAWNGEQV